MGKKTRPFINKKLAQSFHLTHTANGTGESDHSNDEEHVSDEFNEYAERDTTRPPGEPGEAAKFGIFFEDQNDYDYLQHMREVGRSANAVLIEAKSQSAPKKPEKSSGPITLREEESENGSDDVDSIKAQTASEERRVRFQLSTNGEDDNDWKSVDGDGDPEENPDVKQILDALEDDAFINEFDDDFLAELDRESDYPSAFIDRRGDNYSEDSEQYQQGDDDEQSNYSDSEDSMAGCVSDQIRGQSFRDRMTSLTGFSMTSSTMYRNAGLTLLDERFDKIYEEYEDDSDDCSQEDYGEEGCGDDADQELERNTEFNRFTQVMDDFLYNTELRGKHMVSRPAGDTVGDIDEVRLALRDCAIDPVLYEQQQQQQRQHQTADDEDLVMPETKQHNEWDCETTLTTYSNLENRPKVIKGSLPLRQRIALSHKTGLPLGILKPRAVKSIGRVEEEVVDTGSVCTQQRDNLGLARSREETAEEKKQRKAQIKDQKRNRRQEKKSNKLAFKEESKRISATAKAAVNSSRTKVIL